MQSSMRLNQFLLRVLPPIALAMASLACSQSAQQNPMEHKWHASWISSPTLNAHQPRVLHFRKLLTLDKVPEHYVVFVSADNQYQLSINGTYAGSGPSRGDVQHWKYERVDLAPFLKEGTNLIAATVWNFEENNPLRQISVQTGFVLDSEEDAPGELRTDGTWEVFVDQGISAIPVPDSVRMYYYVASPGERFEGRKMNNNWDQLHTDKENQTDWKKARVIGGAASKGMMFASTSWQMVPDSLPPMEHSAEALGKVVRLLGLDSAQGFPDRSILIPSHQKVSILLDTGHMTTAYPEITTQGGDGAKIVLTYSEALYDSHHNKTNRNVIEGRTISGVSDEIYPSGALKQVYAPLDWRTWRYLQIDIETSDTPLELSHAIAWFSAYPFQENASFHSSDLKLTPIWETGWLTARLCAHDTYVDTPYWERLQYVGDTRIQALISYTMSGDKRLARQAIDAIRNSRIPEGISQSRYPSSEFQGIPGFSLLWIGMVHDYWMYNGDSEYIRAQLPAVRGTLDWFRSKQNANKLLGRLPWWSFVDWSNGYANGVPPMTASGDSTAVSLQYLEALKYASELETCLGSKALADQDSEEAKQLALAIYQLSWDEEHGLLADTPDKKAFSQQANALAVWLDVIPKDKQQDLMLRVFSSSDKAFHSDAHSPTMANASFYFRFYLARALVHAGLGNRYLDTLDPWNKMLASGLTTWAENPDPTRSDSHAWSAHPNYDFLTIVAGFQPAAPGFTEIRIEPHPGNLQWLDASMPSAFGLIKEHLQRNGDSFATRVELPSGLKGNLIWNGHSYPLHTGTQELQLPSIPNVK